MTEPEASEHFFYDLTFRDADLSQVRMRRSARILRYALALTSAACAAFGIMFALTGNLATALIEVIIFAFALLLLAALRRGHIVAVAHATFVMTILFVIAINIFEGTDQAGRQSFHVSFLAIAFASFLIIPHPRWLSTTYCIVSLALFAILEMGLVRVAPQMPISRDVFRVANDLSVVFTALLIGGCLILFRNDIARAEERLNNANSRLEDLLGNMLPESIAARLRTEGRTFAEAFSDCTILFADIVGFSKLAARIPPVELVHMLDSVFSRFDDLVGRFGLEKIKTIGDAYMVAAGIPDARPDHAVATVDLALEMIAVCRDYPEISLRIGINSGAVVAGVIGRKRFIYDLWGDAVNIAQRMEQTGVPGSVQITEATWLAIRDSFETESRGQVAIKGGIELAAYTVTGRRGRQADPGGERFTDRPAARAHDGIP